MGKRLTPDQSFDCYQQAKGAALALDDGSLWSFLEDFFLDQMDYDLWHEGQEGAEYKYPWSGENIRIFKEYGITRRGKQIYLKGEPIVIDKGLVFWKGIEQGQLP